MRVYCHLGLMENERRKARMSKHSHRAYARKLVQELGLNKTDGEVSLQHLIGMVLIEVVQSNETTHLTVKSDLRGIQPPPGHLYVEAAATAKNLFDSEIGLTELGLCFMRACTGEPAA